MANVLSRSRISITSEGLIDRLRQRFGAEARLLVPGLQGNDHGYVVSVDGAAILIVFEPLALDVSGVQRLHGAKRDLQGAVLDHSSYVVVALAQPPQHHAQRMRASLALAKAITVVADDPSASAVLWSDGSALLPPGQFRDLTVAWAANPDEVPLLLFMRIIPYQDGVEEGRPRFGVFGVGLEPFAGVDVEIDPQPRPLNEILYAFELVATGLLAKGPAMKDGDTCGASSTEVIRMRRSDAGRMVKGPVLIGKIESLDCHPGLLLH